MSFGILNLQPPGRGVNLIAMDTYGYAASITLPAGASLASGYNLEFTPKKTGTINLILNISSNNDPLFAAVEAKIFITDSPLSAGSKASFVTPSVRILPRSAYWIENYWLFTPYTPNTDLYRYSSNLVLAMSAYFTGLYVGNTYYASLVLANGNNPNFTKNIAVYNAFVFEYG